MRDGATTDPAGVSHLDGVRPFLTFWDRYAASPPGEIADAWRSHYHDLLPADVQRSLERHRFPGDLALALPRLATGHGAFADRADAVRRAVTTASDRLSSRMGIRLSPFRVTTLVGLFGADGWMEWQDEVAHLLIAVEVLESIEQGEVLVHHEIAHVAHQQILADGGIRDVGDALFEEGLATLVPGIGTDLDDGTLCWVGRRATATGEPVAEWLVRCEGAWPAIRSRLLTDFASTTDEAYEAVFMGGDEAAGIPMKAGYYAGLRLVRQLLDQHTLPEIAHWDRDVARSAIWAGLNRP